MKNKTIKIVKEFKNGTIGLKCNFCKGRGVAPQSDFGEEFSGPCSVCKGKGFVIFRESVENLTPCKYCNSTGRAWNEDGYFAGQFTGGTCEICKGTGIIKIKFSLSNTDDFDLRAFHPEIVKHGRELFIKRQWFHSVFEVCKAFEEYVREASGLGSDIHGTNLMCTALSPTKGSLLLASIISTSTARNQQEGMMHLSMGAVELFRNPVSHKPAKDLIIRKQDALEIFGLFSLLYKKIDVAKKQKKIAK